MISCKPKVTVLLTSYNHEKYIEKSIKSILDQTFSDFELVIIDDCSTDSSLNVIRSFKDDRIRIIEHKENLKKSLTDELIAHEVNGQYIAIHHSDDTWELNKLEIQVNFLDENLNYAACFTKVNFIDENDGFYELPDGHIYKDIFETENKSRFMWLNHFFYHGNCLCHPSILIRKNAYKDFSMLDANGFAQLPDFRMWVKLAMHSDLYVIPLKLTNFRYRRLDQSNMSSDRIDSKIRSSIETLFILNDFKEYAANCDVLEIFPDSQNFVIDGRYNSMYILAQKCLEIDSQVYNLFGLQTLFDLLNDKTTSIEVKKLYDFSYLDFCSLTNKYDVFNIEKKMTILNSSLYLDYGNGFSELNKLKKFIVVQSSGEFIIEFNLNESVNRENIINLRFDPDEGRLWDVRIDYVNLGNVGTEFYAGNSFLNDNRYDIFLTTDPFYYISSDKEYNDKITIKGKIRDLSVERIYNEFCSIKEQSDFYFQRIKISDEWIDVTKKAQEILQVSLTEYKNQIEDLNKKLTNSEDSALELNKIINKKEEVIRKLERDQLLNISTNNSLHTNIAIKSQQIEDLREEKNQIENRLKESNQKIEESNCNLDLANQTIIQLNQKVNDLEHNLNRIRNTKMWRIYALLKRTGVKFGLKRRN